MKGRKFPPTFLTTSDVEALLQAVFAKSEPGRLRGAAIIGVLYRTGITVGEAVDLTLEDVDLSPAREAIHVHHGQSRQGRRLALDAGALSLLVPWHEARQHLPGRHLFCIVEGETTGGRWSPGGVREFLNNTREGSGVAAERVHPQAFRYSLLAELIIEQWPLSYIQQQFGLNSARSVEKLLAHLGIEPPTENEVMEVIRTRDWQPTLESAQAQLDLGA